MANLRTNNLCGEGGRNAIRGSVVFGGGDDSAAGLTIADNSELELSSETHWTIEFWIWLNGAAHGDYDVVLGKGSATGNNYEYFVEVMSDNTLEFLTTSTGSAWTFQQQISPVLSHDSWHHVAIVRNGSGSNSLKSYINGVEYGSFTAQSIHTSAYPFGIGYFAGGNNLYSKITLSNLRICKGHAVYTANFTPPQNELEYHYLADDDKTVLLCCQDSDNPLQEATGKTITGVGHLADGAVIHPKNVPPYGVDAGNTFGGAISMNSSSYMYFPTGRTEDRGRGRALIAGGSTPSVTTAINFLNIQSSGKSIDFGDLSHGRYDMSGCSNGIRGVFAGGRDPAGNEIDDTIDFVTIATTANATDFGNLTAERGGTQGAVSSSTRGIWGGGFEPSQVNKIEFVTIATTANATDFGDLTVARSGCGRAMSTTRGLFASGGTPSAVNTIDYITMASTGNAQDFGDTNADGANGLQGTSSNTRGVFAGMGPNFKTIDFVTIATTGTVTDFGDMRFEASQRTGTGNSIRGIFAGGYISPTGRTTLIDQIEIATTGNATGFGDLLVTTNYAGSTSDSHGGLAE